MDIERDLEEFDTVFKWCKENPTATLHDATMHFFPAVQEMCGHKFVLLSYIPRGGRHWEEEVVLSDREYDLLSTQQLRIKIKINGKHTCVIIKWSDAEDEVITEPREIYLRSRKMGTWGETTVVQELLCELQTKEDRYVSKEYMEERLSSFESKPDTSLVEYGEFTDSVFQAVVHAACDEMNEDSLHSASQELWQRRFIEYIDKKWGGTSSILQIEQPWYEI